MQILKSNKNFFENIIIFRQMDIEAYQEMSDDYIDKDRKLKFFPLEFNNKIKNYIWYEFSFRVVNTNNKLVSIYINYLYYWDMAC